MPDDEFPFILTTGRVLEHWHGGSMTRNSKLDDLYPEALMEVNPADAARIHITDGQAVRVSSRRGSVVLRAKVTRKTRWCGVHPSILRCRRQFADDRRPRPAGQDPRI
jgi:anaerobic selenocysteine-containing dehydrogenase